MDAQLAMNTQHDLFDLIQIALQRGPMAGSKPGKRIPNVMVASVTREFLDSIQQSIHRGPLPFSKVQRSRILKWHAHAESIHKRFSLDNCSDTTKGDIISSADSSSIRTKVNKKKLSAKDKGKLRREGKASRTKRKNSKNRRQKTV